MIIAGTYTTVVRDDRGDEIVCGARIVGNWEGDVFNAAEFVDDRLVGTVWLTREDFERNVTGIKEVF